MYSKKKRQRKDHPTNAAACHTGIPRSSQLLSSNPPETANHYFSRFLFVKSEYHTAPNIAKSIAIEAAELLEFYQWSDDADLEHVKEELADVIVYCQNMLDSLGLDVDEIVNSKMTKNEAKYPVEKAKGAASK